MRHLRSQSGFTLTELMVSLAILGIVTGYATWVLGRQGHSYQIVDQVTEAQQSLRGISDLLDREARVTGFLVPQAAALCGQDNINRSDSLYVTDAEALNAGAAELGAVITAGFDGSGTNILTLDSVVLDGVPFYDTDGNGVADSDFRKDAGVIIAVSTDASRGTSCGVITRVIPPNQIVVDYANGGQSIGAGGDLVAIPAHVFMVNGNDQMLRDGMILANGVEDLQFALFYDVDDDDVLDTGAEDPGSADFTGQYASNAWNNDELREIRVNVVVRSRHPDLEWTQGIFQTTENRQPPAGGADGFRRRVLTTAVRPRNVGQRGGI
jgi:prepilin-type N-terminal cleavage/methylation domain-containing protein